MGEATADEVDLVKLQQNLLLVIVLGVAALCIFVQANLTGPIQEQLPVFPLFSALNMENVLARYDEKEWEDWACSQVMVDGCNILGKIALPQRPWLRWESSNE
jgi:hypothetical protein